MTTLTIGGSAVPDDTLPHQLRHDDALAGSLADLTCPVLADVDIGHRPPQLVLINGCLAEVSWITAAGGRVQQRLV